MWGHMLSGIEFGSTMEAMVGFLLIVLSLLSWRFNGEILDTLRKVKMEIMFSCSMWGHGMVNPGSFGENHRLLSPCVCFLGSATWIQTSGWGLWVWLINPSNRAGRKNSGKGMEWKLLMRFRSLLAGVLWFHEQWSMQKYGQMIYTLSQVWRPCKDSVQSRHQTARGRMAGVSLIPLSSSLTS